MGLFFAKMFWYALPVLVLVVGGFLLIRLFMFLHARTKDENIRRTSKSLYFAFLACFLSLGMSAYQSDVKLSVAPKMDEIEHKERVRDENERKTDELSAILDESLDVVRDERISLRIHGHSDVITPDWVAEQRELVAQMPDERTRERYTERFDKVESDFLDTSSP